MHLNARKIVFRIFVYTLSVVIFTFAIAPFLWTIITSLKDEFSVYARVPSLIPNPVTLDNYRQVIENPLMLNYFKNTVVVALSSTFISLFIALFAAYGFSRYKFPGRTPLLFSVLFIRLLPRVSLLVPFYVTLSRLNLVNTHEGLILVYLIIGMPIAVWLMKGYIDALPYEIEEAAVVDGCGPVAIIFKIIVPQIAPALASVGMFSFILAWNEFLFPLTLAKDSSTRPLSVALAFYIDDFGIQWGPLMAASVLMSIPALVFFSFAQKYIVKGLSEGAVKG